MTDHPSALVSVPVEPKPEMIAAWYRVKNGHHFIGEPAPTDTSDYAAYRAMLAAAPAAPQAAGVGERVRSACADFREAIDYFEADVADVMAEGSERADLWDREVTVNIDALKAVMNAALRAPSREPEGGEVRDEIERLIAEAVLSASVEVPETLGERVAMRESITRNLTNAILAVLSPEASEEGEPIHTGETPSGEAALYRDLENGIRPLTAPRHEAPAEGAGEQERLADAYIAGALSVHEYWTENPGEAPSGDPEFDEAAGDYAYSTLADLRARSSAPEAREEAIGNLLAVIHGDGGHRALEVGTKQAALEAEKIVANLRSSAPEAREVEAPVRGEIRIVNGKRCRFIERELEGDKWEVIGPAHPAAPSADKLRIAVEDIVAERQRQIDAEGWTADNDDRYRAGELAAAASAYAFSAATADRYLGVDPIGFWPWAPGWFKPKDQRADLVRAGALIIAEIERIDRAALKEGAT